MVEPGDDVALLLDRARGAGLACGWSALAVREEGGGIAWCSGVGETGGPPVVEDLLWDLASLTKPLALTTLLLLACRDGLDLDAPLGDLLPELAGSDWCEVTVEQCATHTAGFPAWEPLYAGGVLSREGYLAALRAVAPCAPRGRVVEYSCLGFIALGFVLERAGGADLAALFAELVAEPLGLAEELRFAPSRGLAVAGGELAPSVEQRLLAERGLAITPPASLVDGRSCDDGNARGLGGVAGNAGLFGTAAAVARLAAEYLPGGGMLLSGAEAELATRCRTAGLAQARGLGWQLASTPGCSAGAALTDAAFGHTGFTGTSLWADPSGGKVLVLLGNRLHPGGRTPDLHPLRRRFHTLASRTLFRRSTPASIHES